MFTQNQGRVYEDKIKKLESPTPLLSFYADRYNHSAVDEWRAHIVEGRVSVNNNIETNPDRVVDVGDELKYHRAPWKEPGVVPEKLKVLFEDEDVVCINKPTGVPVLPSEQFFAATVINALKRQFPADVVVPVHRLGVGTTGALLCARSTRARQLLAKQFRDKTIHKAYRALVTGVPKESEFSVDVPIGKLTQYGGLFVASPQGKQSLSHCRVLDTRQVFNKEKNKIDGDALVEVRIPTGRPHQVNNEQHRKHIHSLLEVLIPTGRPNQIRIHMAYAGHPLVGDPLYDIGGLPKQTLLTDCFGKTRPPLPRDCGYKLHSHTISFLHPASGERVTVTAPPAENCLLSPEEQKK